MSEEPSTFPEAVPTNHGKFEGPATFDDWRKAKGILGIKDKGKDNDTSLNKGAAHVAQLIFQERETRRALAEKEADIYDDVTGLLKKEVFKREANYKLPKLGSERRFTQPNHAIIASFDGKGLHDWNKSKGRAKGDKMLFTIGQIIKKVGRKDDLMGRGGDKSDEFDAIYFFRDDIVSPEQMIKNLNDHLLALVKKAVSKEEIAGLRWKLVGYQTGKTTDELIHLADPIPGSEGLVEWPPPDVLSSRK